MRANKRLWRQWLYLVIRGFFLATEHSAPFYNGYHAPMTSGIDYAVIVLIMSVWGPFIIQFYLAFAALT